MFWSKPVSLALAPDSLLRIEEPKYEGIRYFIFKLLLFYSKQSKSIRGANVVYQRIVSQVDKPAIYEGQSILTLTFWDRAFCFLLLCFPLSYIFLTSILSV
uniref:Uncharacterized protein MANES_14G038300 n=1 Tax=Rhizophora mucronata TaxID=61149 RepID=A0A2P2LTR5_RHIMU